jgi:Flp pilus assembly pilin Flp
MLRKPGGASMVEYVVLVVLLVGLIGAALLAVANSISQNLSNVYNQLDS